MLQASQEKNLNYLAIIALKIGIDSNMFSECIVNAWARKESKCKDLTVKYRDGNGETASFLFTRGDRVLGQMPLSTKVLKNEDYLGRCIERSIRRLRSNQKHGKKRL